MARFERDGKVFEITSNDGRYKHELRTHLRGGWNRVSDPRCEVPLGAEPRNAVLEEALHADPDDLGTKLVYADWLQQQGHPRGALIAVQHRLAATPDDPDLAAAERKILVDAVDSLISKPLLAHLAIRRRGGSGDVEIEPSRNFYAGGTITFDHGFIREAQVELRARTADEDLLWELLRHPSTRALAKLDVELDTARDIDLVAALLVHGPCLPLRRLALHKDGPASASISFTRLGVVYPFLEDLSLKMNYVRFAGAELPRLKKLALATYDTDIGVAVEHMPALEDLSLTRPDPDKLVVAFETGMLPKLRRLEFAHAQTGLVLFRLAAKLGKQLEALTMTGTYVTDSIEYLVENRARFPRLEELRIKGGILRPDVQRLLDAGYPVA